MREPFTLHEPEQSNFPWKWAAAAVILLVAGFAVSRTSIPSRIADAAPIGKSESADPPRVPAPKDLQPVAGELAISTQPPGAKVLIDGKAAGQTPLTLTDVSPGRHVVTLVGPSGAVKRTVKIEPGKNTLDVPIFSGFAAIFAPIVLDVSENGRSLGNTEQERIMLAPGHHELRLANRELNYVTKTSVDIDPGEVQSVSIDPRGTINLNAQPWAEVWVDGKKVGETPVANLSLPLGAREVVFKNPQYGERKVTTTVRAGVSNAISIDFTKPQRP